MNTHYGNYITTSAAYCEKLFRTAELFFAANALVEHPIAADAHTSATDLDRITAAFVNCSHMARSTVSTLIEFQEAHETYPSDSMISVNFRAQLQNLETLDEHCKELSGIFSNFSANRDLQKEIWAHSSVTNLCISSARIVCELISWQCSLADEAHSS